jgi:hypothetical protein
VFLSGGSKDQDIRRLQLERLSYTTGLGSFAFFSVPYLRRCLHNDTSPSYITSKSLPWMLKITVVSDYLSVSDIGIHLSSDSEWNVPTSKEVYGLTFVL